MEGLIIINETKNTQIQNLLHGCLKKSIEIILKLYFKYDFVPNSIKQSLWVQCGMILTSLGDRSPVLCPESESLRDLCKSYFYLFAHFVVF